MLLCHRWRLWHKVESQTRVGYFSLLLLEKKDLCTFFTFKYVQVWLLVLLSTHFNSFRVRVETLKPFRETSSSHTSGPSDPDRCPQGKSGDAPDRWVRLGCWAWLSPVIFLFHRGALQEVHTSCFRFCQAFCHVKRPANVRLWLRLDQ